MYFFCSRMIKYLLLVTPRVKLLGRVRETSDRGPGKAKGNKTRRSSGQER